MVPPPNQLFLRAQSRRLALQISPNVKRATYTLVYALSHGSISCSDEKHVAVRGAVPLLSHISGPGLDGRTAAAAAGTRLTRAGGPAPLLAAAAGLTGLSAGRKARDRRTPLVEDASTRHRLRQHAAGLAVSCVRQPYHGASGSQETSGSICPRCLCGRSVRPAQEDAAKLISISAWFWICWVNDLSFPIRTHVEETNGWENAREADSKWVSMRR